MFYNTTSKKRIFRLISLAALFICHYAYAENKTITFPNACIQGKKIVIAAMGDLLLHRPLQQKASSKGFESLWGEAIPYIQNADIAYANLEGPIAIGINHLGEKVNDSYQWDFNVYSDFPLFNYHPQLAKDLKKTGFSIVSTANNHAFDRHSIGVDKTLDLLDSVGIAYVGSRKSYSEASFVKIVDTQGVKIAWIACTEHTNGQADTNHQMLYCYKPSDKQWILKTIQELKPKVDAIIVSPHWGVEYQEQANQTQQAFAKEVLNAGATAVIGSHPHVLQPVEKFTTTDGRATLISYSLGNFISFQGSVRTRSTIILLLGLTKSADKTIINGVRFVPMVMVNRNGTPNIHLAQLSPEDNHLAAFGYISRAIPLGNALYSLPIVTNPECFSSQR